MPRKRPPLTGEEKKKRRAAYQQKWRAENPDKWKAIMGPSRKKWRENNFDRDREIQRSYRYSVRLEILYLLGGARCVHCGFDDWRALQIDHIHGGGIHDRATFGGNNNLHSFRNKLRQEEFYFEALKKYQVLCANCNWIKRCENGEQPNKRTLY